jgi:DNA-binding CsgD family transcriptional regulator
MGHFLVFAFLAVFLAGVWTALAARQQYRAGGGKVFRSLFRYQVAFNLLVFGCFVARYAHTNLIGDDPYAYAPADWAVSAAGAFVLEAGLAWTILELGRDLRRAPPSRLLARLCAVAAALLGISYVVGITLVFRDGSPLWIVRTHQALTLLLTLAIGASLIGVVAGRLPDLDAQKARSARRLGWLLLGGYLVLPASFMLPETSYLIGFAAGLLWLSCAPLLWLHRFSTPCRQEGTPEGVETAMAVLARRHDITPREQEIMALIVEGKSNKEIEDLLCISFSTVKNHVYNLFRKLGVNSRTQLMHLVMVEDARSGPGGE